MVGEVPHPELRQPRPDRARPGRRRARLGLGRTRIPGLRRGDRRHLAGALPSPGDRRHPGSGGNAPARLQPLPRGAADPSGQAPHRALVRRSRVLLELRRRGERGGPQGCPQVRARADLLRPRRVRGNPQFVPRTHVRDGGGDRPGEIPARLRAPGARLQARGLQRPARHGARDRQPHGGRHRGMHPGRGRRARRGPGLPARAPQALRSVGHAPHPRRDPDRRRKDRAALGLPALRDRARHHDAREGARQRGADRRHADA